MLHHIDTSENFQVILKINFGYCKEAYMKKKITYYDLPVVTTYSNKEVG